ncbi:phage tail spike protein [Staphylococcus saprophyticus]|nr:phage tail spike protein [Staphylococcus saprophyticus]
MIHLLNFKGEIIDFISEDDGALFEAVHDRQQKDKKETFDFTILSSRAEKFRERNRVITKDSNGQYREFIITGISDDMDGLTDIQTNASYLEDIGTAKPFVPGKLENMTTSQALYEVLRDTGWEVAPDTEYNGLKTTTWTAHKAPYDVALQLETTYDMELDFYIELGSNKVEHRYAVLKKPKRLFKGKEVKFGKDLTGLSREIDFSEIKTALMVVGPEDDDGNTTEVIVTDDQAQEQFGLPQRYIWDVYKPESQNSDITERRLKALGENELDKIKTASVTYEISSLDIDYLHQHESTSIGDTIRVKDTDFNPPLYLEADVIGEEYDLLGKESVYSFGKVIRYREEDLTQFFRQRLQEIREKLNDDITNLNTQLQETAEYTEKYYEQKIVKQPEPPTNPVDDMLWYDTSNPDVSVLRRYRNGEWHNQTASDVQQLGGMTREETIYNELVSTFEDLQLQHTMLQSDVYDVINSQYLVDTQLKEQVQTDLDSVSVVFNQIKTNLDSMDKDTATIGKLMDTQAMFQDYRENLQKLNDSLQNAKISIDERLKLLQQQYTEEKLNDAMTEVAKTLPNGEWNSETGQLLADIPNQEQLTDLRTSLQAYTDGQISNLNSVLGKEIDSKINTTKNEISASISSVERKIDGIEVGGRNLIRNSEKITDYIILSNVEKAGTYSLGFEPHFTENIPSEFGVYNGRNIVILPNDKPRITHTFEVSEDRIGKDIRLFFGGTYMTHGDFTNNGYISKVKLEYGNVATDWTPAPEDIEDRISNSKQEAQNAAIADAENKLKPITTRVATTESDIKVLQDGLKLTATKTEVEQTLNDKLTPIQNQVNEQKATLDVLPEQIASKVSKSDYTTDQNNIVSRLDSAETERQQLSDEINDRVTLKNYETFKNEITEDVNSVQVGARNLLRNSLTLEKYFDEPRESNIVDVFDTNYAHVTSSSLFGYLVATANRNKFKPNTYTFSMYVKTDTPFSMKVGYRDNAPAIYGNIDVTTEWKRIVITFTTTEITTTGRYIYWYPNGNNLYFSHPKLETGNKVTDWSPAPEDIQEQITKAEQEAKKASQDYTDAQDELALTKANAYADGVVSDEEQRAIEDAEQKLEQAKSHAVQKATESEKIAKEYAESKVDNLNVGTRNLLLNSKERDDFIGLDENYRYISYELTQPLTVGREYTLAFEIYDLSGEPVRRVSYLPYDPTGERRDISVYDDEVKATFTATEQSMLMYIYKGLSGATDPTKEMVIKNAMLVEGNKVGDYSEAPEIIDTRLTEMETSITQNGEQIQDRVSLTEYNKTNKTLSQVISTLTQDTTNGLTYTFDENGKITSFNVGNDGVKIRGDSVDITVNDDFKVVAQDLNNKVDQDNIINRLNLSPEGLDIDVNNLGIRGGDSNEYLKLENDTIELHGSYTRTWQNSTDTNNVFTRFKDGHLRFRNNDFDRSIYISDFGISTYLDGDPRNASGTLEFFDYTYDSGARGVTLQSGLGVVALRADSNRMVIEADDTVNIGSNKYSVYLRPYSNSRVGVNEFQFYVKLNPTADATDGVIKYGNITGSGTKMGSGIRFSKSQPIVYATNDNGDMGSGYFHAKGFQGDWITKNTNVYACVNGELRVTDINGYNGGDIKYKDIRFKNYYATSSEKYKYDIQKWDYEVLDVIKNDLQLYSFKREEERGSDYERNHRGVVIERETPTEWVHRDGVDNYEMLSWSLKAIQELAHAKDEQDEKIKEQSRIIEEQEKRMDDQEERLKKLEELINAK